MILVADTTPLNYLIRVGHVDVLREFYGRVLVTGISSGLSSFRLLDRASYARGFDDFRTGDSVAIIHNTAHEDEAEAGYIVGLYDRHKDKVAMVGTNDLDNLMMESDEP